MSQSRVYFSMICYSDSSGQMKSAYKAAYISFVFRRHLYLDDNPGLICEKISTKFD